MRRPIEAAPFIFSRLFAFANHTDRVRFAEPVGAGLATDLLDAPYAAFLRNMAPRPKASKLRGAACA